MFDFGALPPEINSGLMYTGPGSGPMLAAGAAWDDLAAELYSTASSYGSLISDLTSGWLGPSSASMAAAAVPYVSWITTTAGQAEETGAQAKAAAAAFETAFAMTVPPPVIAANRALLLLLIATNFFGQNTPAIMATEAHYMEVWAQDAAAMFGYQAGAQAASVLSQFTVPANITNLGGLLGQLEAVAQAVSTQAGTTAQTVAPLTSAMSSPLSSAVTTTPVSTAVPNTVSGVASTVSATSSSSSSTAPLSSLSSLASSSTALTSATTLVSGTGSSATMPAAGLSLLSSASSLMNSMSPAASTLGNQLPTWGSVLGSGVAPGTGMLGTAGLGNVAVTAGVGRAATLGVLSVPQGWASAAPAVSQVTSVAPSAGVSATPAVAAANAANPGAMFPPPLASLAARETSAPIGSTPRIDVRPSVVPYSPAAG